MPNGFMENFVEVVEYKRPRNLIGETVTLVLKNEPHEIWFKILGSGQDPDDTVFIAGVDKERMNRKIYIKDIEKVIKI